MLFHVGVEEDIRNFQGQFNCNLQKMAHSAFHFSPQTSPPTSSSHSISAEIEPRSCFSSPLTPDVQLSQHDYNCSPRSFDESSATEEQNGYTDEELGALNAEPASSRSSISSLPASVAPSAMVLPSHAATPTKDAKLHESRVGSVSSDVHRRGWRDSPFRNPSSVRNMQMRDEADGIPHHRTRTSRMSRNISTFTGRSSDPISQTKRRSAKNSLLSPRSTKVKTEFPLVLLHCSLLPPAMPIKAGISDVALLQAVLPEEYWTRWELLTDKITSDLEIQGRGVLIPHPKADYELLEERLLESLELVKPKLRSGHYYGNENVDEEAEQSESDAEVATQVTKCQDCGKRVVQDIARDRIWEVKVYAANGLMRAGAWSAAWNEMEKVDVEVNVFLPADIRREVEERYLHLGIGHDAEIDEGQKYEATDAERRRREIYGNPESESQDKVDGFFQSGQPYNDVHSESSAPQHQYQQRASGPTIELTQLFINYLKTLAQDRRNAVIGVLGLAVILLALNSSVFQNQGYERPIASITASVPSLGKVPPCTDITVPSALPIPLLLPAGSISTPQDLIATTEYEAPMMSADAVAMDLQLPLTTEKQEVTQEVITHDVKLEA